ncbi:hypothetical protein C8R44DRAFT_798305 [Mycena epipterygia]|nr:hypothetical protein C8R44DRAFT_798305 [Mycena epipterygia]
MSNLPDLNGSLGATEIGSVLGVFLFGIETLQTFNYYRGCPGDSIVLKRIVALVWFLELGHTMSAWHALYSQTVTFYGQPQYISSPPLSEDMTGLFAALIYTVVQTFFANRVRVLSGNWCIMVVASCLTGLRLIANMGSVALLFHYSRVSILLQWRWLVSTALSLGLAVDILITGSMCHFLHKMRSTEFKRTRTMVETLIVWSIESTILTSTASIIQIILFMTRTDLVWSCFFIIHAKLFSNSMLASLNGRRRFSLSREESSDILAFKAGGNSKLNVYQTVSFTSTSERSSADVEKCKRMRSRSTV